MTTAIADEPQDDSPETDDEPLPDGLPDDVPVGDPEA
jgi:hypothetical protein